MSSAVYASHLPVSVRSHPGGMSTQGSTHVSMAMALAKFAHWLSPVRSPIPRLVLVHLSNLQLRGEPGVLRGRPLSRCHWYVHDILAYYIISCYSDFQGRGQLFQLDEKDRRKDSPLIPNGTALRPTRTRHIRFTQMGRTMCASRWPTCACARGGSTFTARQVMRSCLACALCTRSWSTTFRT